MNGDGEWWDVLDVEGVPTGSTFRKDADGWPPGRFHLIVAVCVQREDSAVLLTQRAVGKEFAFGWEFPGGSALAGESSRDAAARELREETGIEANRSALVLAGRFTETSALLDFYIAGVVSGTEVRLQQSEVMAAQWVTPQEVIRQLDAGLMADPWAARLESLWPSIAQALTIER